MLSTRPATVPLPPLPFLSSAHLFASVNSWLGHLTLFPHPPELLPHLQQRLLNFRLLNFRLPSVKLCSAFCILIAFSPAFNEQSGLFLYWGPAGKFQADLCYERNRWNPRSLAWIAVGRRGITIYLRENVHLTCSLNSKEMSSTQLCALWQLKRRLEGGLVKITETTATAGKISLGRCACLYLMPSIAHQN